MSADNWAICPKCKKSEDAKQEKLRKKATAAYGKVPPDEYLKLLEAANNPQEMRETLREDYQIGVMDDGEFDIEYSAYCDKCGFKFSYKHAEDVPIA